MSLTHPQAADASDLFWNELIDENDAADFLKLSHRTMQAMRCRGGGPRYVALSARCIRYRRSDLKTWIDSRSRASTSQAAA